MGVKHTSSKRKTRFTAGDYGYNTGSEDTIDWDALGSDDDEELTPIVAPPEQTPLPASVKVESSVKTEQTDNKTEPATVKYTRRRSTRISGAKNPTSSPGSSTQPVNRTSAPSPSPLNNSPWTFGKEAQVLPAQGPSSSTRDNTSEIALLVMLKETQQEQQLAIGKMKKELDELKKDHEKLKDKYIRMGNAFKRIMEELRRSNYEVSDETESD